MNGNTSSPSFKARSGATTKLPVVQNTLEHSLMEKPHLKSAFCGRFISSDHRTEMATGHLSGAGHL
jgi:hypothetical protein